MAEPIDDLRLDLRGRWRAIEADDDVRRHGIDLDSDDDHWETIEVPGHWRNHPKFAASDGPIMYRRAFAAPPPADRTRRWVTLDGIFYQADVWLDGAYLGDPEGYFFPHTFEITALSGLTDEHVLAVETTCAPNSGASNRRNITGVFQQSDDIAGDWNPGGLWRSALVYDTGPVRIDRLRVVCRDADPRRAHIRLASRLDSDEQRPVIVRTSLGGEVVDEQTHVMASGSNEIEWGIDIAEPELWWPRSLGEQHLHDVIVEVVVDDQLSDRRARRTGLRQVQWDHWTCSINGERIYLKGVNLLPSRPGLADVGDLAHRDIESAVELGLDVVRVHGHIADRSLYAAADQLGILVLQDFPLQWGHARHVRGQAVEQARAAVDTLGHHPSIVQWNAHNDPAASDILDRSNWKQRARNLATHQLPTWNKSVLDRWVKRAFEKADPTRETVAHSGVQPHFPQLDGTDSHLWYGWKKGEASDLAGVARRMPRLVRFVSEFGAHSVPGTAPFIEAQLASLAWPDLDWDRLESHHGYQRTQFELWFPPDDSPSFDQWRRTTQLYQSRVLKTQIETLRRLKYRPSGGFCFSSLADPAPAISSSVLDHARQPKDAFAVVAAACAPVLVVADQPPDWVNPGDKLSLNVHVVNDLRHSLGDGAVEVTATWAGGAEQWLLGGPIGADSVTKAGRVTLTVPDTLGELAFELVLSVGEQTSRNRYTTAVTLPPGD